MHFIDQIVSSRKALNHLLTGLKLLISPSTIYGGWGWEEELNLKTREQGL